MKKTMVVLKTGVKYCSRMAVVAIGWDIANGADYFMKNDYGLMTASIFSVMGGFMLSGALFGLALGPVGLAWAVIFIFGSAIYMAFKGGDEIQKWLKSCLWRKAKEGLYTLPEIYPTQAMEIAAFNEVITSKED